MSKLAETPDEAVARIKDETFDKYNAMKFRTQADAMEAAIRQGIAWAYRDAVDVLLNADDEVNAGAQLERKAEEASR